MLRPIAIAGVEPLWHWSLRLVEPRSPGALPSVGLASVLPSRFHFPASLGSTSVTTLPGYYGRSDSCPAVLRTRIWVMNAVASRTGLSDSGSRALVTIPSPNTPCRPGIALSRYPSARRASLQRAFTRRRVWASPLASRLAAASGRIEFTSVTDWSLTSGCSPPRLTATQLPSVTGRRTLAR